MDPARTILDELKTNERRQKENSDGSGPDHLRQTENERKKAEGEFGWLRPGPS